MNFPVLSGYPYALKAPFPSADANQLSEQGVKTINATDGSAHAPTGDIELSGVNGGGLDFDTVDPVPFKGSLDVTAGLLCTAPIAGSIVFDELVALDVRGPMTFKGASGAPGSAQFEATTLCTFATGSTLTCATGSTVNLTGDTFVRGTITIKASGGPGSLIVEAGCSTTLNGTTAINGNTSVGASCVITFANGSALTGGTLNSACVINQNQPITFSAGVVPALSPVRTWNRRARLFASTLAAGVSQGVVADSPLFSAPSIYSRLGSGSAVYLYLEFDPPHGGIITAVAVRSVLNTNPLGAFTRATYELVRWDNGLDAAATSLSSVATDAHAAGGGDWNTVLTTNLAAIDGSQVDRTHDYGVRVTAPRLAGNAHDQWYDVLVTGTIAELNGQ